MGYDGLIFHLIRIFLNFNHELRINLKNRGEEGIESQSFVSEDTSLIGWKSLYNRFDKHISPVFNITNLF